MSLKEQARNLIDQAEIAIKANNPQYATELLRQSILYNGKDADAYILLGIALAQTSMPADAENAFKRATQIAPDSVKARYNLTVHQYSQGQVRAALNNARKASRMAPEHEGSRSLSLRIEQEMGLKPGEQPKTTAAGNPSPVDLATNEAEGAIPTIPFVERLGRAWIVVGVSISVLSLIGLLCVLMVTAPHWGQDLSPAIRDSLYGDPRMIPAKVLFIPTAILAIIWTGMDAVYRKGNLLWLLPQVFCGCTGFAWLMLPAYILFGRKQAPPNE